MIRLRQKKGQMIVIALFVIAVLLGTIPLLVRLKSQHLHTATDAAQAQRARQMAEAAFANVLYVFESQPALWEKALAGDALSDVGFDGSRDFEGLYDARYRVTVKAQSGLVNTLQADLTLDTPRRSQRVKRLFRATLTRQTMGADPPGYPHAPAALYAGQDLHVEEGSELVVHWGSIVTQGTLQLATEPGSEKYGYFPRKYARRDMFLSHNASPPTDGKEYWAASPFGPEPVIDLDRYRKIAQEGDDSTGKTDSPPGTSSGYLSRPGKTVALRRINSNSDLDSVPVLYLDSNISFECDAVDLNRGAVIVTQNAIISRWKAYDQLVLRVPGNAGLEYPFLPKDAAFPCQANAGGTCPSLDALGEGTGAVAFRGFLYVKGDLTITQDFVMAGVLRVDGRLRILNKKRLTIFFDEQVSRSIPLVGNDLRLKIVSEPEK